MKIISFSPSSKSNQQVWLKFDDSSFLPFKLDDIVLFKIKKNVDISTDEYRLIQSLSASYSLNNYALRQLAISPKTKLVLTQKLSLYSQKLSHRYNFSKDIFPGLISKIVTDLDSQNYLNESDFVSYFLKKNSRKSASEIRFQLQRLGISRHHIPSAISGEQDKIRQLLLKKLRHQDLSDVNTKNKIISFLFRKGFAIGDVKTIIDEHLNSR